MFSYLRASWRLTALCVTSSSTAAFVNLRWRAAVSKVRSADREGSCQVMPYVYDFHS